VRLTCGAVRGESTSIGDQRRFEPGPAGEKVVQDAASSDVTKGILHDHLDTGHRRRRRFPARLLPQLSLRGELDLSGTAELAAAIDEALTAGAQHVMIDLYQLTFIDMSGGGALLRCRAASTATGSGFLVTGAWGFVRRVLDLAGIWPVLSRPNLPAPATVNRTPVLPIPVPARGPRTPAPVVPVPGQPARQ
jgi:anti-anti-sigma factor